MNVTVPTPSTRVVRAPRRTVLTAFLVLVAVLFGLIAMHSITIASAATPSATHAHMAVGDATSAPATMELTALPASIIPALAPVCDGACELGGLMFEVVCTLTMAAVLTLMLYQRSSPRVVPAAVMRVSAVVAHHLARLKPPSLFVLSVSRI